MKHWVEWDDFMKCFIGYGVTKRLETLGITLGRWKSCTPREKGFSNISSKKLLGRPVWFTECPWFKNLECQERCPRKKIRPWERGDGHWDILQMLAIIWELWKCGPSKPRVGLPLKFLFCPYWQSGHSGEPPSGFAIDVPHGARWPSQGESAGPAPQASPNWRPTSQVSGTALAGHGRRVHTGGFGPRANSRALSLPPLPYQISAFGGDDSAFCRLQSSEVCSAHWAGYIVIKEGNAVQK